jgi:hypothetical protein
VKGGVGVEVEVEAEEVDACLLLYLKGYVPALRPTAQNRVSDRSQGS